jgi:aminoglycoside phosphotransferase (APT) family kinase protein
MLRPLFQVLLGEKKAPVLVLPPQGKLVQLTHDLVRTYDHLQRVLLCPAPTAVPHLPCADKTADRSGAAYSRMAGWLPFQHLRVSNVD